MSENLKTSEIKLRVRYGETDQMGIVYYGNYAQYFEVGRTEWLRNFGVTYKQMEADGFLLPVVTLNVRYKKPAYYDDLITVVITLVKIPSVTIEFSYNILNEKNELLVQGNTVLAFVDLNKNKPTRCPQYLLDKLHD